jgi:hypothetical protein
MRRQNEDWRREWIWQRCPGCGRKSSHHPDAGGVGEFHSDGCPLEGLYQHTGQWWFEREIERLATELRRGDESSCRRAVVSYAVDETQGGKREALLVGLRDIAAELIGELGMSRDDAQAEFEQVANDIECDLL